MPQTGYDAGVMPFAFSHWRTLLITTSTRKSCGKSQEAYHLPGGGVPQSQVGDTPVPGGGYPSPTSVPPSQAGPVTGLGYPPPPQAGPVTGLGYPLERIWDLRLGSDLGPETWVCHSPERKDMGPRTRDWGTPWKGHGT